MSNQFLISYMSQYESFLTKYRLYIKTLDLMSFYADITGSFIIKIVQKNWFYEKYE